jgi:transcriptional regulator with XRE-family HTH domain
MRCLFVVTFGQRLRLLRERKGLVQKQISDFLGVSESTVGKYENDQRTPPPDTITKLATYFNVSTDYLLGVSNERKPGSGVKAIDNPEVTDFMKTVVGEFRLDPNLTPKDQQEIIEDLAEYFRFKIQQKKNQRQNY